MSFHHTPSRPRRRLWIAAIIVVLVTGLGIGWRIHGASALRDRTEAEAIPTVATIKAAKGPAEEEIILPGNVQAWHEATIYARTNGYMKRWLIGMGTPVKEGELLAEIETPEVDAGLAQAEADLKTAEANYQLAQTTAERWKILLATDSVSKQETDEKIGDAASKLAAQASARANRNRLRDMESFKRVVAPFDGVISARTTDIGQLINAGGSTQQPLFHIVQADRLRIYVKVPQAYAGSITPELTAELHVAEHPGKTYPAVLYKTAEAIDPASRTLLTEFKADNADYALLAGGYAEVHMKLPAQQSSIRLPVNTLLFRSAGAQVAVVDGQNKAVLRPITIGRDFGNEVEIVDGVAPDEAVIVNPPDSLMEGQTVRIAAPEPDKKQP